MPSAVLRVAAVGTYDAWTLAAGANKVVAVDSGDPVTHDDATTNISDFTVNDKESYTVLSAGSPAMGAISAISIGVRSNDNTALATIGAFVRVNGVDGVELQFVSTGTGVYTTRNLANPLKSGSVPVQGSDVQYSNLNFQVCVRFVTPGGATHTISTLWMDLTFVPPSGGFAALVIQWLGPLVAVGLHEIPKIAQAIHRKTRGDLLIQPSEYAAVYRELREGRFARHFFLGAHA